MDDRVSGGLALNDINFQIYIIGYIEREQERYSDKELNFQNIYHRLNILTREAIHEYVMDRAEKVKGMALKSLENEE